MSKCKMTLRVTGGTYGPSPYWKDSNGKRVEIIDVFMGDAVGHWQGRAEKAEARFNNLLGSIDECLEHHMKRDGLTQEIYSDLLSIWEKAKEAQG